MKLCTLAVLLLLLGHFAAPGGTANRKNNNKRTRRRAETRIVGGDRSSISASRYLVSLRRDGTYFCAGALVTERHVVTAAHCIYGADRSSLTVVGGTADLRRGGVQRRVVGMWYPRAFRYSTKNMDVGVIKLNGPMRGANIRTVPLCNHQLGRGGRIRVAGWGTTAEQNTDFVNQLRAVSVPLVGRNYCARRYRNVSPLTGTMICAGGGGRRDSCRGDSGAPGIHRGQLCAVVSFGVGCARRGYPGVYTSMNNQRVRNFVRQMLRR